jgi:hypothetical protein
MGYTSDIRNRIDGKKYLISTAEDKKAGGWQTAVLKHRLFGIPDLLHPAMFVGAVDEEHARQVHARVERIVAELPSSEWEGAKWELVTEVLDATQSFDRESGPDLSTLAILRGQAAEAILSALTRDQQLSVYAPEFETRLGEYKQEGARDLVRMGYRLRLAEFNVMGGQDFVPLGQVDEILRSGRSSTEKIEAVAQYLDTHDAVGLGDPVRLYILSPFEQLCKAFDELVEGVMKSNPMPSDELDSQFEVYARLIAYGYVYKVAEDLVGQRVAGSESESQTAVPELERSLPEENKGSQLWASFHNKPNTKEVLCEKARLVARLIEMDWDKGLVIAARMKDTSDVPEVRLGEEEARRVLVETAALLIRIVHEIAFGALSPETREVFMDELEISLGRALESKGVELTEFASVLAERISEHSRYRKWVAGENEPTKDTLFWEYAKKIGAIVNIEEHLFFTLELTNLLLRSLERWGLKELLAG